MRKCEKCGKEFEKNSSYSVHRTHCLTGRRPWNEGLKLGPQSGELKKRRLEACRISHEKKYPNGSWGDVIKKSWEKRNR